MKVRFVVVEPETKRGTYDVPLPIVVGRGAEARFRIQQDRISRKHCELFDRDGDVYVRDLGSTNGTFLDGEQIAASIRTPVPPGSVLKVGTIEIRIDYEGSGRLAPATPASSAGAEDMTMGFVPVEEEPAEAFPSFGANEPAEAAVDAAPAFEEASQEEPISEEQSPEEQISEERIEDQIPEEPIPEEPLEAETPPQQPAKPAKPTKPAKPAKPAAIADATAMFDTQKAPEPGDFGGIEAEEPAIEAFTAEAFGAAPEPEPAAEGSFEFLAGSQEERPAADPELGDFFKGLK